MGGSSDGGQITPESMTQPDKADALIKMLIFGAAGMPGAGAGTGAGAASAAGAGNALAGAPGLDAFSASPVTSASPDLMSTLFPQPANPMSSMFGMSQNSPMSGILNTMQRIQASPFHQGGIPGEGQSLGMPELGGVMLPKRRTSGRMF